MEIWKDIRDYEGSYQVSNQGRIKSLMRGKERIMKPGVTNKGYFFIPIYRGNKRTSFAVHRLVYQAFKGELIPGLVVDHINGIRSENNVDNLQQITQRLNTVKGEVTKNRTSKYPGVSWSKDKNKWKAAMSINGKVKYLGAFEDELEAHEAYQKKLSEINFLSP